MRIDHLAVVAATLDAGVAWVESRLGVAAGPVGRHARMGTWNRLISLGPREYLEVIAIDPEAAPPGRPRWFDLDRFAGPPRIGNWIAACDSLTDEALPGAGEPLDFRRGDFRWRMAVPADGRLPFDGLQPAQIEWQGDHHPAPLLPDVGCRLERLELVHPQAGALAARLATLRDPRLAIAEGARAAIRAAIRTPGGVRLLA